MVRYMYQTPIINGEGYIRVTYKWMETLTEENLQSRGKSAGRKITMSNI